MSALLYILLGIVQGLTEFLPVSSSGHLVLLQNLFGLKGMIQFDIVVHGASFFAIVLVFRKRINLIIRDLFREIANIKNRPLKDTEISGFKFLTLLLFGIIPTIAVAVIFKDFFEGLFDSVEFLWVFFLITGFIIYSTKDKVGQRSLTVLDSLIVGLVQGFAIIPGISRSGITISACIHRRMDKDLTIEFSFLLGALAIFAAAMFKFNEIVLVVTQEWPSLLLGFLAAFVSSYIALRVVIRYVKKAQFYEFAFYCWTIGIISFIAFMLQVSKI